jgi:hypothetical protein
MASYECEIIGHSAKFTPRGLRGLIRFDDLLRRRLSLFVLADFRWAARTEKEPRERFQFHGFGNVAEPPTALSILLPVRMPYHRDHCSRLAVNDNQGFIQRLSRHRKAWFRRVS